jgi:hypothetical protein
MSKRAVSDAFDGPDAIEKAAVEAALNRCRVPPGRVVRGIRRAFYANPGRELTMAARPSLTPSRPRPN